MKNNNVSLRQELLDLLVKYAYQEGDFTLSSGQKSSFYLNCKQVTLRAQGALLVGKLMFSLLDENTAAVAGLTLGADPLVSAVSVVSAYENHPIPALIIRKEAKGHGTKAYIEGPSLETNATVIVLEDVVTTGKSAMLAVERLREAGYQVKKIISLVDRQAGGGEFYESQGLEFESIFTLADIQTHK
ncbi:MAG: orotate phosphoribosyltransferase [Cyanobacteria bacterium]|nr:orotate phosphoribosyltransferase [Cyanobacteria bacterium CG_2015-16_32_12]NCO76915.1 orotate phosphoribosyltransferase [Cyanobacteria bacterium CG_2015-22_32_23]NCQ05703.1 orotate phosphoribosyltransferase [Cyanobacteria bacterium CG_2015-09_32_10]NCQ41424.1 orotate phosphoribosyltransferase [Cyanobacteria bacterium CG_2015-04_32_10]